MSIGVIVTGGTIASTRDHTGSGLFAPRCGSELRELVSQLGSDRGYEVIIEGWRNTVGVEQPLLDSCDIDAADWLAINQHANTLLKSCTSVVVLHGTDTLAYTASALAMLSPRRSGAVILTGSQVPLTAAGSDAEANLGFALDAAAGSLGDLQGDTLVAFGGQLMRGVRVTKYSTRDFEGFQSFNSPVITQNERSHEVLAQWQTERAVNSDALTSFVDGVVVLRVVPGMNMGWLRDAMLCHPPAGIVLELFGVGSAPEAELLAECAQQLWQQTIPMIAVSACDHGGMDWQRYEATAPLRQSPLIDGGDMRTEAAVIKLRGLLAEGDIERLPARFAASIAGECVGR